MIGLVMAGVGAGIGAIQGMKAGDEAKALAERQAELQWMATQEEVRRMEESHEDIIGTAKVDVGASGFTSSSQSQASKIAETETEFAGQREMKLFMGREQAKITREGGAQAAQSMKMSGIQSGLSMGASAGSAMSEWYK